MPQPAVGPINLAAAAMITQFSIIVILLVGVLIIRSGEPIVARYRDEAASSEYVWVTMLFTVSTVGVLFFTAEFASMWKPVFGYPSLNGLPLQDAVTLVFAGNALTTALLVYKTGGSRRSPFSPMLFALPPLAIFLRQPVGTLVLYSAAVAVVFTMHLIFYRQPDDGRYRLYLGSERDTEGRAGSGVFWFVAIACFALTTAIGIVTRPQ